MQTRSTETVKNSENLYIKIGIDAAVGQLMNVSARGKQVYTWLDIVDRWLPKSMDRHRDTTLSSSAALSSLSSSVSAHLEMCGTGSWHLSTRTVRCHRLPNW